MKVASVEAIVDAMARAKVRYLVAGGIAVNAHGHLRLTNDVDLVIQLEPDNVRRGWGALEGIGYRPTVPVTPESFADSKTRGRWIREKGMQVLRFWSDHHRETPVDVFVAEPFDFENEYEEAFTAELAPGLDVRFVQLKTLIEMKEQAGRPLDLDDAKHLRWILEETER